MPIPDVAFRSSSSDIAFPFFTGAQLFPPQPTGMRKGDLLLAHIWSNGTAPGQNAFQSIPTGWTFLATSYLENHALNPPSATWLFYKIATDTEPANWKWLLPRPTLNIWTVLVYDFYNADPANLFNKFTAIVSVGVDGSPRAGAETPDWRNDVSLLLFAAVELTGVPPWPPTPVAPDGYTKLAQLQNQGNWQVGFLGVPNSCNFVPDVFDYTEAQQISYFGFVRFRDAWFSHSFLIKNINVTGQSCAGPGPPPVCDTIS